MNSCSLVSSTPAELITTSRSPFEHPRAPPTPTRAPLGEYLPPGIGAVNTPGRKARSNASSSAGLLKETVRVGASDTWVGAAERSAGWRGVLGGWFSLVRVAGEQGDERLGVGTAPAGDGVPAGCCRVSLDRV